MANEQHNDRASQQFHQQRVRESQHSRPQYHNLHPQRGPPAAAGQHPDRRLPPAQQYAVSQQPLTTVNQHSTQQPVHATQSTAATPPVPPVTSKFENLAHISYPFVDECFVKYEKLEKIGQGTFGEVFKAKDKVTKEFVALKKILMDNEKEGFPITALREIKILQLVNHVSCENIIKLIEICRTKASPHNRWRATFYLVFEFADHDLAGILSNHEIKFSSGHKKEIMKQLFDALFFIHSNKIIHRDMKAANVLITNAGILKLADFGLARLFTAVGTAEKPNRFTNRVVTLWYRPPELLLGDRNYGPAIDMWGAGCIMVELWTRIPILQGNSETEQLLKIIELCGSINETTYPGCTKLEQFNFFKLTANEPRHLTGTMLTKHHILDEHAVSLLDKLFSLDPTARITADDAVDHDWFWYGDERQSLAPLLEMHRQSNFEYTTQQERHRAYELQRLHQQRQAQAAAVRQQQHAMHHAPPPASAVDAGGGGGPVRHHQGGAVHAPPRHQPYPTTQQQQLNDHSYAPHDTSNNPSYAYPGQRSYASNNNNSRVGNRHHPYHAGGGVGGGGRQHYQNSYAGNAVSNSASMLPNSSSVNGGGAPTSSNLAFQRGPPHHPQQPVGSSNSSQMRPDHVRDPNRR